ncbi:MAG: hypothetical protein CEN91_270 [Candidatus Berkelbacteria bacterium Licking1014_85]|uniref:Uncharacterized protein n=1 Tax=Candidatus Berkelbacteria bacterium Licking1014_85 TaxID=2017148 RepID=A0A554LKC2_9BACT|nr:MAG: hypothetical protein CEN91_270 [Candidatus Berkelbacteria bacterium Licking1014_85]
MKIIPIFLWKLTLKQDDMSLDIQKKNIFILSLLTTLCALVWIYTLNIIGIKISELRLVQDKQNSSNAKQAQITVIENELIRYNITIDKILSVLPSNNNFLAFIAFLESSAASNSVALKIDFDDSDKKGIKTPQDNTVKKDNKVVFALELNGRRNDVIKAISQIETDQYFVNFEKVDYLSRSDDASLATAKLKGAVYVHSDFKR